MLARDLCDAQTAADVLERRSLSTCSMPSLGGLRSFRLCLSSSRISPNATSLATLARGEDAPMLVPKPDRIRLVRYTQSVSDVMEDSRCCTLLVSHFGILRLVACVGTPVAQRAPVSCVMALMLRCTKLDWPAKISSGTLKLLPSDACHARTVATMPHPSTGPTSNQKPLSASSAIRRCCDHTRTNHACPLQAQLRL